MATVHIVPIDDWIEHETEDCVCGPDEVLYRGEWVIIHHSLDGRELEESDYQRES